MDITNLIYRIAFASVSGMGIDLANKFLDVLPSEKAFFDISEKELQLITNSKSKIIGYDYRQKQLKLAQKEAEFIERNSIKVSYFTDSDFPTRLLNATDAPILLYSMGSCNLNAKHTIAIVGTRHATHYGQQFVDRFIEDIAQSLSDVVIVSGLAYGIDIMAHKACLQHNVPTAAVLAHGLNTIYPTSHRNIAADIVHSGGALITDYSSQSHINKGNFVARNRIVAALSDCTIVVESAEKGGALITAQLASSYNREVFALPGRSTDEFSSGCNKIIMNNEASLITSAHNVLHAMQWKSINESGKPRQKTLFPETTPEEDLILNMLKNNDEMHINTLTARLNLPVYQILSNLVELEFKGLVTALPGCRYTLTIH